MIFVGCVAIFFRQACLVIFIFKTVPRKRITVPVDEDALWEAIRAVQSGEMTIRGAAMQYGVSKSTLCDHKNDTTRPSRVVQGRFRRTFNDAEENELVEYILEMSKRFYGMTRLAVAQKAYRMAEVNNITHPFRLGKAGKDWVTGFLRRHSDKLSMRTATPISLVRVTAFTRPAVDRFFDNLEELVMDKKYDASCIFNMDESGITIVSVSFMTYYQHWG